MKTIGVIGGLGPQATMDFEEQLHKISLKLIPQHQNQGYPPLIVCYIRQAPMKLNADGSLPAKLRPSKELLEAAKLLGQHADFLVIPSNTPHIFLKDIEKVAGKKVLSIVDVTMTEIQKRKYKKVGILAIGLTLKSGLYQRSLGKLGISYEIITDQLARELDKAIFAVMEGKVITKDRQRAENAVKYLKSKGVENIILGCSELPLLLKYESLINPTQLLAEAAIRLAIK